MYICIGIYEYLYGVCVCVCVLIYTMYNVGILCIIYIYNIYT